LYASASDPSGIRNGKSDYEVRWYADMGAGAVEKGANGALMPAKNEDKRGLIEVVPLISIRDEDLLHNSSDGFEIGGSVIPVSIEEEGGRSVHTASNPA